MGLRYAIVALFTATWKILYYTPRTHKELRISKARQKREVLPAMTRIQAWSPFS